MTVRKRGWRSRWFALPVLLPLLSAFFSRAEQPCLTGVVEDASGAAVAAARIDLRTPQGAAIRGLESRSGAFSICGVTAGSYLLSASAPGLAPAETPVRITSAPQPPLRVVLRVAPARTVVTVTASRGLVEEASSATQMVSVAGTEEIRSGAPVNLGASLQARPGILVQESTYGQISPYLRGFTGYQTLLLLDGIRFNTSVFRSGPNQYLGYIQPSQVERVEAILGPAGANFGSDAMGGVVQVVTGAPRFGRASRVEWHGELAASAGSADASAGSNAEISAGGRVVSALFGVNHRRVNDLRAGDGADSRNAFRRYFGLDASQVQSLLGSRLSGTSLSAEGAYGKLAWRRSQSESLTLSYQWSGLRGVRSYRDQLGGPGRLQARVEPQGLNFGYARYERLRVWRFDSLSGVFSVNSQRDGAVRQALRPTDTITTEHSRVDAYGYSGQAAAHLGRRFAYVFGGEAYDERILSTRFQRDPVAGSAFQDRGLLPNGSRYLTAAAFGQSSLEIVPGRLRTTFGARYTAVGFATYADRNRDAAGRSLGVTDTRRDFRDATFNASLSWRLRGNWGVQALAGRGFRAPNATDLGAVGVMTALGFDIPAEDLLGLGALIGADSGDGAVSTGKPVRGLRPESLYNYEAGVRYAGRQVYGRVHLFDAELIDPIVSRTVLFRAGDAPEWLAGLPLAPVAASAAQREQGVTAVATPLSQRAVKASVNDGRARYYGGEAVFSAALSSRWSVHSNYTFLAGRELDPNRPVRRLPPQMGQAAVRHAPPGRRPWLEFALRFAGPQTRLGGGDLDDDRIGASRRRVDIADFFNGGIAAPWIAGGRFTPTGETLRQIQDRVLPLGSTLNGVLIAGDGTRVPLYLKTAGWCAFDVRGGLPLGETLRLYFGAANLFDRNYRVHGSGIDAAGINVTLGLRYAF
ncbi:MAG: TonB-dependent receptor [Bryobacteraceae bacterium]